MWNVKNQTNLVPQTQTADRRPPEARGRGSGKGGNCRVVGGDTLGGVHSVIHTEAEL